MRKSLLRTTLLTLAACGLVFVFGHQDARAAINPQMTFQGKLTNTDGTNVTDGSYSIRFRIYTDPSADTGACANTCKWEETHPTVSVSAGLFTVNLGSGGTALPGSVDFNSSALYLGVKVGTDSEMSPRVRMTAVAQAFNSDLLDGLDASALAQLSPGSQQTGNINISGTVTSGAVNGVTIGSTIQPSAAGALTISSNGSNALNLTGGAASTWDIGNNVLSIQTTNNGAITTGTGLLTSGGNLTFSGTSARTITGPGTGGLTLNVTSGPLALSTTTSGTLSVTSAGALALGGTSVAITSGTNVTIGTSDTSGTLLVLDTKTNAGDPAGTPGGMYYNSSTNKFRCYQNAAWKDCDSEYTSVKLTSDQSRTATTFANVTGLTFAVAANTDYDIECTLLYDAAATTTAAHFAVNGPASPTALTSTYQISTSATADTVYSHTAYNNTTSLPTASQGTTRAVGKLWAVLRNGANAGTFAVRFKSEVSGSAVNVRTGSYCKYRTF